MSKRVPHKPPGTKTRQEAAQYLGVCVDTLDALVKKRKLRVLRPTPRTPYFRQIDLDAFLSKSANMVA